MLIASPKVEQLPDNSSISLEEFLPATISDVFANGSRYGFLTLGDRFRLRLALLEDDLTSEDLAAIDRLLRAVARGRIVLAS